jgi:hypothetical protein
MGGWNPVRRQVQIVIEAIDHALYCVHAEFNSIQGIYNFNFPIFMFCGEIQKLMLIRSKLFKFRCVLW